MGFGVSVTFRYFAEPEWGACQAGCLTSEGRERDAARQMVANAVPQVALARAVGGVFYGAQQRHLDRAGSGFRVQGLGFRV